MPTEVVAPPPPTYTNAPQLPQNISPTPRCEFLPNYRPPGDNTVEVLKSVGADVVVTPALLANPEAYARAVSGLPLPRLGLNCTGGSIATSVSGLRPIPCVSYLP